MNLSLELYKTIKLNILYYNHISPTIFVHSKIQNEFRIYKDNI